MNFHRKIEALREALAKPTHNPKAIGSANKGTSKTIRSEEASRLRAESTATTVANTTRVATKWRLATSNMRQAVGCFTQPILVLGASAASSVAAGAASSATRCRSR